MPLKSQDTKTEHPSKPNHTTYGKRGELELDTEAEETQEQEYNEDGLQKMAGYSADQDGEMKKPQTARKKHFERGD